MGNMKMSVLKKDLEYLHTRIKVGVEQVEAEEAVFEAWWACLACCRPRALAPVLLLPWQDSESG